ncbi:cardiolipin synthase [Stella humosa]|uniref:CDP-diacylglycerol--glycerol-3-phosphate 3-phosphatidyltransferase n=1 Tax=Stella humosa TaxID=94 RepID=A0A3N1LWG3_9PROT|nr:CDP-alcohol phosphatidyltransferase family protein [Stella humosa]ROP99503.1 cardiolipin synthase [Stella humosa]BBK31283.1 CDP-diacylglycerol--glycerol-3-phosphate 3-phosphatidyltransferase [Stella humosa]
MYLANIITLGRLLSVPVIVWLILDGSMLPAFALFVAAGISDAVDGFLARRFDQRSELGGYLDPLADKALLVGVYVTLGHVGHLPAWLVILVVFRDVLIIGGAILLYMFTEALQMAPLTVSKVNTAAQIVLAAVVLGTMGLAIDDGGVVRALVYAVGATTALSGAAYIVQWSRHVSEPGNKRP